MPPRELGAARGHSGLVWAGHRCSLILTSLFHVMCQTPASSGLGPPAPLVPWSAGSLTETSGGPELSDSLSSGGIVPQPPLRKVKVTLLLFLDVGVVGKPYPLGVAVLC